MLRRTLARLDVCSSTLFALIEPGSCFAGTLLELALAADRSYMLADSDAQRRDRLSAMNFGPLPCRQRSLPAGRRASTRSRARSVTARADRQAARAPKRRCSSGSSPRPRTTLDWERRGAHRHRRARQPFAGCADRPGGQPALRRHETMASRIFGRLSAWQNWIFIRPNAVGQAGALKVYGTGSKARFNRERV